MPKAYSYLRFSTPEQAKGDSRRRQADEATAYAREHGLDLDDALNFRDLGVSGYSGANVRKGALGQFLRLIDEGLVEEGSYLLVEDLDRVSRQNPWDALPIFQQIMNAGITIVTLKDRRVWSRAELQANPFRIFESIMVMIRAHEESATKSFRLKQAWTAKRARASEKPLSARGPGWLRLRDGHWEIIEERAEIVRRVFRMAADGRGQNAIAQILNAEGVPTWGDSTRRPARHWHRTYIVKVLRSPSVVGILVPHTQENCQGKKIRYAQEAVEDYYPSIVPRDVYDAVQALQLGAVSPQRGRHAERPVRNVLGGLARCPLCGDTMTRVTKGSTVKAGRPYLVCQRAKIGAGCSYRAIRCEGIENGLATHAKWITATGPVGASSEVIARQIEENAKKQEMQEAVIGHLVREIEAGAASPALREALARAEESLQALKQFGADLRDRADMAEGPVLRKRLGELHDALTAIPLDPQRTNLTLRMVLSEVVVDYRSGNLLLRWKHGGESIVRYAEPENPDMVPEKWQAAAKFLAEQFPAVREQDGPTFLPRLVPDNP
jgi:DNA invertase Pin-like site-specific DNA recombinase